MSSGAIKPFSASTFQLLELRSMSSKTSRFGFWIGATPVGGLGGFEGIQGSSHTLVFYPDPIDFLRPDFSSGLVAIRLRHTYDVWLTFSTSIGLELQKYIPFSTLASSEEGYCTSRHSCFASKARLKFFRSRKPVHLFQ